jgi:hypothetical protein
MDYVLNAIKKREMMDININLKGVDKLIAKTNPKLYSKALNSTINKMGSKLKTAMTRDIKNKYNIKLKDLKKYIKIKKSSYSHLEYRMDIDSKTRNVKHFGAKVLKGRGRVSVKIKKDKGRSTLRPAFRAKSGAILTKDKRTNKIKAIHTLSVTQMFNKKTLEKAEEINDKEFRSTFKKEFDYYIGKEG